MEISLRFLIKVLAILSI